jgi:hypothetical protein
VWPTRKIRLDAIENRLQNYAETRRALPGIEKPAALRALALQIVASTRRLDYTNTLLARDISPARADPYSTNFDAEKAAIFHARAGRLDEAVWLTFLATHVGKRANDGWLRLRHIYGGLGTGIWNWERVSSAPDAFREWLRENSPQIGGGFGNHRKYESLSPDSPQGTAAVVASYVAWVGPSRSHAAKFAELVVKGGNDPKKIFDAFYNNFDVSRFGRLGKFDFLALLGRLGLAPLIPGSAYLKGATGPLRGARLLFTGDPQGTAGVDKLQNWLDELDADLGVGMQVLEDSLCNWQKSPGKFIHFKG